MKTFSLGAAVVLFLFSLQAFAADAPAAPEKEEALLTFLEGSYDAVGKSPDGGKTYWGEVTLIRQGQKLIMTRIIGGKTTIGSAIVIPITSDAIYVLRADFTDGGHNIQALYSIGSDADNYARLTGRLYLVDRKTQTPGMEALFIRHPAD